MTNDELSALPEFNYDRLEVETTTHDTIAVRTTPKLIKYTPNKEDIVFFSDSGGDWAVIYNLEGGPYKWRMP